MLQVTNFHKYKNFLQMTETSQNLFLFFKKRLLKSLADRLVCDKVKALNLLLSNETLENQK